jgi:hypothetical protein
MATLKTLFAVYRQSANGYGYLITRHGDLRVYETEGEAEREAERLNAKRRGASSYHVLAFQHGPKGWQFLRGAPHTILVPPPPWSLDEELTRVAAAAAPH